MNLNKQIRAHRTQLGLSQDTLAAKLYVSRQTISNWENGRTYPDIENLLLLSVIFNTSLDELVKGDLDMMKDTLHRTKYNHDSKRMILFILLAALSVGPSLFLPAPWYWFPFIGLMLIATYYAIKVERFKHQQSLRTFREILAFEQHQNLDAIRTQRNRRGDWIQLTLIVMAVTSIVAVIALISTVPYLLTR